MENLSLQENILDAYSDKILLKDVYNLSITEIKDLIYTTNPCLQCYTDSLREYIFIGSNEIKLEKYVL